MSATATTTTPIAPRPRLVAKAASGHQASAPKASGSGHKNGGSGPDPMQVWNKNRGKDLIRSQFYMLVDIYYSCSPSTTEAAHR